MKTEQEIKTEIERLTSAHKEAETRDNRIAIDLQILALRWVVRK